jgi:hypothetical protein
MNRKQIISGLLAVMLAMIVMACDQITDGDTLPGGDTRPGPGTEKYTVTFDVKGGDFEPEPQIIAKGDKVNLPGYITKANSGLFGWYREEAGNKRWNFATDTVSDSMTLSANWEAAQTDTNAIAAWITAQPDGTGVANPIYLPISIDLGDMAGGSGWEDLLAAINTAGKYVELDLTPCALDNGEFKPRAVNPGGRPIGEDKITKLILPEAATKIAGGSSDDPSFEYFAALTSIEGLGITAIGDWAFTRSSSLTSASFPAAESTGNATFSHCTRLSNVSLPAAVNIGSAVFNECSSLSSISLPKAVSIGAGAFYFCRSLTSVRLPVAVSIGHGVFYTCISLSSISLPKAVSIGDFAFSECTSLSSISLPVVTSIDECAFSHTTDTIPNLTITMGPTAPTLGNRMFLHFEGSLNVTVKVPGGATGYGSPGPYSGSNSTANWGNGFRGGGWDGLAMLTSNVHYQEGINPNITLTIQTQ